MSNYRATCDIAMTEQGISGLPSHHKQQYTWTKYIKQKFSDNRLQIPQRWELREKKNRSGEIHVTTGLLPGGFPNHSTGK